VKKGVDDDRPDERINVDTFFRGFQRAFEGFEMCDDILNSRSSTEEIQDSLSSIMVLICYKQWPSMTLHSRGERMEQNPLGSSYS